MAERWRPVVGYKGLYEVSDQGRVRRTGGRVLRDSPTRGYRKVQLWQKNRGQTRPVHTLVLEAFAGPRPSPGHEGNHRNGVKTDNRLSNLEWATRPENIRHGYALGLITAARGERGGLAKLTTEQVREIRALRGQVTQRTLARRYGVAPSTICQIQTGQRWAHLVCEQHYTAALAAQPCPGAPS